MQKISDNVYVETGFRGCNTSLVVTGEGVVVIDTPMVPSEAKKWRDEAAKFGPVRYVIDTEPHIDHVCGNGYFEGTVVGHEGTREAILNASVEELKNVLQRMAPESLPLDEGFRYRPPEITLCQRLTIYLGKHTFNLINMPGHSPYQVAVHVPEERVVFTSDNVSREIPFFHQALPLEWLDSLDIMKQMDVDIIVPGHGDVGDKSCLDEMTAKVKTWIDAVAAAIDKGMSLEEAQEKVEIPGPPPAMAPDERMLQMRRMGIARIYQALKK